MSANETILNALNWLKDASSNSVQYVAQTLTSEQQEQARTNIGAVSADDVITKESADETYLPLAGGTMTGSVHFSPHGEIATLNDDSNIALSLAGGDTVSMNEYAGCFQAFYPTSPTNPRGFRCVSRSTTGDSYVLEGNGDGELTWNSDDVVCSSGVSFSGDETQSWVRLSNGLQMVWGMSDTVDSTTTVTSERVSLSVPFLNRYYTILASDTGTARSSFGASASSTSYFTLYIPSGGNYRAHYLCIGQWE